MIEPSHEWNNEYGETEKKWHYHLVETRKQFSARIRELEKENEELRRKAESLEVTNKLLKVSDAHRRQERARDTQFFMAVFGFHGLMDDEVIRLDNTHGWLELIGNSVAKVRSEPSHEKSFQDIREAIIGQMHVDILDIMHEKMEEKMNGKSP